MPFQPAGKRISPSLDSASLYRFFTKASSLGRRMPASEIETGAAGFRSATFVFSSIILGIQVVYMLTHGI